MGTRLYLNTDDISVLEQCAGVPAGTHAKLEALDYNAEDYYHILYADQNLKVLNNFVTFGFGRFDYSLIPKGQNDAIGSVEDGKTSLALFRSANNHCYARASIVLDLIEKHGVHWS